MTERDYFNLKLEALSWLMGFRQDHPDFTFRFAQNKLKLFPGKLTPPRVGPYFYVEVAERAGINGRYYFNFQFQLDNQNISIRKVVVEVEWRDDHGNINQTYQRFAQNIGLNINNGSGRISFDAANQDALKENFIDWLRNNYQTIVNSLNGAILSQADFDNSWQETRQGLIERNIINQNPVDGRYQLTDTDFANQPHTNVHQPSAGNVHQDNEPINNQKYPKEMKSRNLIMFGAPGTGKSHKLEENRKVFGDRYERVTFYPTYSYAQFVGTYKPVMKPVKDAQGNPTGKEEISYEFVPGPFLRVLVNALNEVPDAEGKKMSWCLVIEEINRANAAAVFGDVFQLLDRGADGVSEYAIAASEDVKKYLLGDKVLNETGKNALRALTESLDSLKIPANMYIWATMNSADQGVFPMDTAFKRRWAFEYLGLDDGAGEAGEGNWKIGMKDNKFDYKWEDFRRYVNRLLALAKVNEDKLMGPFFMKKPADGTIDKNEFESKVLMYLWEDAGKMCRRQLFGDISTYSELIDEWEENGIEIFSPNLRERDTIDRGKGDPKKSRNAKNLYEAFKKTDDGPKQ